MNSTELRVPEDFRCPISLEVMSDPVILWTGQTYERHSIQQWLDSGHTTCPKTKQELHNDTRLIPNYALRSLIQNWAQANRVELHSAANCLSAASLQRPATVPGPMTPARQREFIESLLKVLRKSGNVEELRDCAREIRIMMKEKQNRAVISEVGGVPVLLSLLKKGTSPEIEENAVVALLNMSADDEYKVGLVADGAVDAIVRTLWRECSSMDTKASAALAITSLSMVDVNKAIIGQQPEVIPGLAKLLRIGNARGRKDAIIALYSLCMLVENRYRAVSIGVVDVLLQRLDGEASFALLDVLSSVPEGRVEMGKSTKAVTVLVRSMGRDFSVRSRESCAAVLCAVSGESAKWAQAAREARAVEYAKEMVNCLPPDSRAVRKASRLLQILQTDH